MTVGIVGLGLIGGSFAKAYHRDGHRVLAYNRTRSTYDFARMTEDVDDELTQENISTCDIVLVSLFPEATIEYIKSMAPYFGAKPIVMDCSGTKRGVCSQIFPIANEHGFTFVGGHPMAGTHNSGFKYATADMYVGAPLVIVPQVRDDIGLLDRIKKLTTPAGFGSYAVTTADEHDRVISFTSQLAHVVSNAYIKSPTATAHKGFSAGSYKDLTRVAWLSPVMWAELFMENKDNLSDELDVLIRNLVEYQKAMADGDMDRLVQLLDDGRRRKEEVDGH